MDRASWLLKALHEASGEVQEALLAADGPPPPGELLEIAWDLALGERADGWHVEQLLRGQSDLTLHPAEWLATGAEPVPVRELVRIYSQGRAETCGMVWGLSSRSLALQGRHPFRGLISLEDVLVSLHERDIETMLALQRLPTGEASASAR
ncbi:MAG: hypothetical protein DK306_000684 [Chloroflexi bacterium]|nr:MAG: hypothetical protein DK306_000684 [Chloroflexota bacterium]